MNRLNGRLAKLEAAVKPPPVIWSAEEQASWESMVDLAFCLWGRFGAEGLADIWHYFYHHIDHTEPVRRAHDPARRLWVNCRHRLPPDMDRLNTAGYRPCVDHFDRIIGAYFTWTIGKGARPDELKHLEVYAAVLRYAADILIEYHRNYKHFQNY